MERNDPVRLYHEKNQINCGRYKDLLHWTDENHTTFRIRWKHQSNKNLVADDYEIFKAWAMYTEKYNEDLSTPSKCKLNFRCAMNSTKRFEKLVSNEPDFRIYKIIPLNPKTESPANPSSGTKTAAFNIKVSIYYHNKLQDEAEVNSCMFTYNQENCHQLHNVQVIQFPNPEVLSDQKRVQHTLTALNAARLLLYQKNSRIWAKRLGTCQVFHAFSKELDNPSQDPPCKLLPRNVETEIFDYEQFCRELADFRDGQRRSSPDYTIYLCFGQRFTASKPKESKLILMKVRISVSGNLLKIVQGGFCLQRDHSSGLQSVATPA
uniref:IRF tryptophan pentad repeat domain-containing protein n=1 Tax=Pseudonaja textilis TaxID=8673 RepID=A0A670XZK7_PSETE